MSKPDDFNAAEIAKRAEAALRVALSTPPTPHEKMKQGPRKRVVESRNRDSTAANKNKGGRRPSKHG